MGMRSRSRKNAKRNHHFPATNVSGGDPTSGASMLGLQLQETRNDFSLRRLWRSKLDICAWEAPGASMSRFYYINNARNKIFSMRSTRGPIQIRRNVHALSHPYGYWYGSLCIPRSLKERIHSLNPGPAQWLPVYMLPSFLCDLHDDDPGALRGGRIRSPAAELPAFSPFPLPSSVPSGQE
jgi:hypothetical protein